jgi:hypothetical protein
MYLLSPHDMKILCDSLTYVENIIPLNKISNTFILRLEQCVW